MGRETVAQMGVLRRKTLRTRAQRKERKMSREVRDVTEEQIQDAELGLEDMYVRYLTERGWEHRCDYPDSHWRWEKEVVASKRTVTMTCSTKGAYHIESDFLDVD